MNSFPAAVQSNGLGQYRGPSTANRNPDTSGDLSLYNILRVIGSHLPAVLLTAGLVLAAGLLLSMLIKPKYTSTAVIDVADSTAAAIQSISQEIDPAAGSRDAALLQSQRMAILVLQALNPGQQPTSKEVREFQKDLGAVQEPETTLVRISYTHESPERAAEVVNLMIEQFKSFKREYLNQLISQETIYVERELEKQRDDLSAAEKRVDQFKVENGLTDNLGITLKVRQISTLNSQLLLAQIDAQKAESRRRQMAALERSGNTTAISALSDSPLVQRLREQEADLRNQIRELQNEYGPKHPVMVDARSQLAEVRRSIANEIQYVSSKVKNNASIENERVKALQQSIAKLETDVAIAQSSVVELRELEREADSSKQLFEGLLSDTKNLKSTSEDLILSKLVTVISQGYESSKAVFPRPEQIMLLTAVAATILGLMAAFLAEQMNPRVTSRRQRYSADLDTAPMQPGIPAPQFSPAAGTGGFQSNSPERTASPIFAESIPNDVPTLSPYTQIPIPGDGHGIVPAHEVLMKQHSQFSASIRSFNGLLGEKLARIPAPHAVLITADQATGDKLSVAAALATLNAAAHKKVIIVDLTRGETAVHRAFGLKSSPGITEVMETTTTLFDAIQTDYKTHVSVFSTGKSMSQEMTAKFLDETPSLLALLKKYFDLIIVVARNLDIATTGELVHRGVSQSILVISPPIHNESSTLELTTSPKLERHAGKLLPILVNRS